MSEHNRALPHYPYLKPWFRTVRSDQHVVFQYGARMVTLRGRAAAKLLPALLPLLDGTRSVADVCSAMGEAIRPATEHALRLLHEHGLVSDRASLELPESSESLGFLSAYMSETPTTATASEVHAHIAETKITVVGDGPMIAPMTEQLKKAGFGCASTATHFEGIRAETADVVVVNYEKSADTSKWNLHALEHKIPWLWLSHYDGTMMTVGPMFIPGETACHECFSIRHAANLSYGKYFRALNESTSKQFMPPFLASIASGVAAWSLSRWTAFKDPFVPGRYEAVAVGSNVSTSAHTCFRVPRCPACSEVARVAPPTPWFEKHDISGPASQHPEHFEHQEPNRGHR